MRNLLLFGVLIAIAACGPKRTEPARAYPRPKVVSCTDDAGTTRDVRTNKQQSYRVRLRLTLLADGRVDRIYGGSQTGGINDPGAVARSMAAACIFEPAPPGLGPIVREVIHEFIVPR